MGKLPRARSTGRSHFADYPYGRGRGAGEPSSSRRAVALAPRARRGSSTNLAPGGVYINLFCVRGGPPSAGGSRARRLKRLDFVHSCGADLASLAAAAYRSGRAFAPAALVPPLAAVERRVAATAAPLLAGAAARVDALLAAADARVDGVCAAIGLPAPAAAGALAPLAPSPRKASAVDASLAQVAAALAALRAVAGAPAHARAAADALTHLLAAAFAPGADPAAAAARVQHALGDLLDAVPAARRVAAAPGVAAVAGRYRSAHAALVGSPSYERALAAAAAALGRLQATGVGRVLLAPVTAGPAARLATAPAVVAIADHLRPVASPEGGRGSPRCLPAPSAARAAAVLTCAQC
jgi:hypothetical protein